MARNDPTGGQAQSAVAPGLRLYPTPRSMLQENAADHRTRDLLLLAAVVLLGTAVRLYQFGRTPLWDDEAITYFASSQGLGHLFGWLPQDPHPPLHYLLETGMVQFLGRSEAVLRLPSLLAGVVLIAATGIAGLRLGGRVVGIWAALLAASSPVLIWQSHNARCYSLLALTMLLSAWFLWRHAEASSWRNRSAAAGFGLAAVYLHYLGFMLLPVGLAAIAVSRCARQPVSWAPLAVILAGAAPLGLLVSRQLTWMRAAGTERVPVLAAIKRAVHVLGPGPELDGALKLPLCALFAAAAIAITVALLRTPAVRRIAAMPAVTLTVYLSAMFGFVTLSLWAIVDYHFAILIPPLSLLAGVAISALTDRRQQVGLAALTLAPSLIGAIWVVAGPPRPISDFATARRLVIEAPSDAVILPRQTDLYCYSYYRPKPVPVAVLGKFVSPDPIIGIPLEQPDALIAQSSSVWVMSKGSENGLAGFKKMHRQLTADGFHRTHAHRSPGLMAVRWERSAPAPRQMDEGSR